MLERQGFQAVLAFALAAALTSGAAGAALRADHLAGAGTFAGEDLLHRADTFRNCRRVMRCGPNRDGEYNCRSVWRCRRCEWTRTCSGPEGCRWENKCRWGPYVPPVPQ